MVKCLHTYTLICLFTNTWQPFSWPYRYLDLHNRAEPSSILWCTVFDRKIAFLSGRMCENNSPKRTGFFSNLGLNLICAWGNHASQDVLPGSTLIPLVRWNSSNAHPAGSTTWLGPLITKHLWTCRHENSLTFTSAVANSSDPAMWQ